MQKKDAIVIFEDDEANLAAYELQKMLLKRKNIDIILITNVVDGFRWLQKNSDKLNEVKSFVFDYDLTKGYPKIPETQDELKDERYTSTNSLVILGEIKKRLSQQNLNINLLANSGTNNSDLMEAGCTLKIEPAKDFNEILTSTFSSEELKSLFERKKILA